MSDPYRADTTVTPEFLAEFNAGTEGTQGIRRQAERLHPRNMEGGRPVTTARNWLVLALCALAAAMFLVALVYTALRGT